MHTRTLAQVNAEVSLELMRRERGSTIAVRKYSGRLLDYQYGRLRASPLSAP